MEQGGYDEWQYRKQMANISIPNKSEPDTVSCNRCCQIFSTSGELQLHHISCDATIYKCEQCGQICNTFSTLQSHLIAVHSGESNAFTCELCNKQFTQRQHFVGHLNGHQGVKPFQCQCGQAFTYKSRLTMHKRTCGGDLTDYNFKCDQCGKTFGKQRYLRDHVKGAHGEHRYTCEYCGEKFMWRSGLQSHKEKRCEVLHTF